MDTGASADTCPVDGRRLDSREDLNALQLPAWDGVKHFITYDRTSVHKPTHAPSTTSAPSRCTGSARLLPTGIQPRVPRWSIGEEDVDPPPLLDEEDDEDFEDNQSLSQYQAETNRWLLFSGIFALIITLFIVNFSTLPHQAQARKQSQLILSQLATLTEQIEATPQLRELSSSFSATMRNFNLSAYLDPPSPTLAMEIRDEWAPALWYSSLMMTLMGTMITLIVKQWLMTCTFSTWPALYDYDSEFEDILKLEENLEHEKDQVRTEAKSRKEERERVKTLRNARAQRKAERRRVRKETLKKTERVKSAVPWLMYSALGMFVCGVVAKLGSLMWIGHA